MGNVPRTSKWSVRRPLREWPQMLLGGVSFWLPDIIYHYLRKTELTSTAIWEMAVTMPLLALLTYATVLVIARRDDEGRQSLATSMLLGIWILAPTMITLGTSFAGAGFKSGLISALTVIFATALFPIFALMMAGYDLTIPALLLVTIMLVGARFVFERRRSRNQVRMGG
jgi:hypothetical protein